MEYTCLIGRKERSARECQQMSSCAACGFEEREHRRRIVLLKNYGLKEQGETKLYYLNIGRRFRPKNGE